MKVKFTVALVLILLGLGTADALLTEPGSPFQASQISQETEEEPNETETPTSVTKPPVRKQTGPDVAKILEQSPFAVQTTEQQLFLNQIILPEEATVHARALLIDDDRAGSIAWVDSAKVKIFFLALKEALHVSFTPEVRDLVDETKHNPGKPPQNVLTFIDPGISEERIVFVRVRQQLFEVHVAEGHEKEIFELIDNLTK